MGKKIANLSGNQKKGLKRAKRFFFTVFLNFAESFLLFKKFKRAFFQFKKKLKRS